MRLSTFIVFYLFKDLQCDCLARLLNADMSVIKLFVKNLYAQMHIAWLHNDTVIAVHVVSGIYITTIYVSKGCLKCTKYVEFYVYSLVSKASRKLILERAKQS